jgi:hypothetical protein
MNPSHPKGVLLPSPLSLYAYAAIELDALSLILNLLKIHLKSPNV